MGRYFIFPHNGQILYYAIFLLLAFTLLRILPFTAFVTHVKNHLFKEILKISHQISLNFLHWYWKQISFEINITSHHFENLISWFFYGFILYSLLFFSSETWKNYSSSHLKNSKTETRCWSMASWTGTGICLCPCSMLQRHLWTAPNSVFNEKALVVTFNQKKTLEGTFSLI